MNTNALRSLQQIQKHHEAIRRLRQEQQIHSHLIKIDFNIWLHLFVESLEFADIDTLINAQQTCHNILLLMAQRNLFRKLFFKIQPFPRRFISAQKQLEVANRPVYWVSSDFETKNDDQDSASASSSEHFSIDDHPFIESEISRAKKILSSSPSVGQNNNENDNNNNNILLNSASWKCVTKRYLSQTEGVFCRVSTPEFFRGIWRMPERNFWKKSNLDIEKSPPFFMAPRIRRKQFNKLRQSPFPSKIAQQQQFQLLLQRQNRNGESSMGVFLNVPLPIEGNINNSTRRRRNNDDSENDDQQEESETVHNNKIEVLYSMACLDQSLFVPMTTASTTATNPNQQFRAIRRRFQGSTSFHAGRNNSGFAFGRREVSSFDPDLPFFRDEILSDLRKKHQEESPFSNATFSSEIAPLHSCEDIVIEVEVFSLGPGVEEADDVLTYAESFGQVLALAADERNKKFQNCFVTLPMQIAIWGMIRNLSHTDPYTMGIMAKRKKLLAAILDPMIKALSMESELDLCLQVTGVLWNLSDVDVPPVSRDELQEIIQSMLARINHYITSEKAEYVEDEHVQRYADSVNSEIKMTADPTQTPGRRHQRRYYVSLTPSFLGCLWNFPQSLSGTIDFFLDRRKLSPVCQHHDFLLMILRVIKLELRQDEQNKMREATFYALKKQEKEAKMERKMQRRIKEQESEMKVNGDISSSNSDDDEDDEKFQLRSYEKPKCGIIFAACHFLARAIYYLFGKVHSITNILQEQNAEQVLCDGVSCLRKNTTHMGQLGVALFSRDFAIFFVPLLIGTEKRSTRGCLELAAFAFNIGYWTSMEDEPEREQQQQQNDGNQEENDDSNDEEE